MTFHRPFVLPGMEQPHPAGTFAVSEKRESLDLSWPAFRITITIMLPTAGGYEAWPISTGDLDDLLGSDKACETTPL